jgi:hypothetical protein
MRFALAALLLAASTDPRTRVREALVTGDLPSAVAAAREWSKASPDALGCYAALLEADGRYKEAAAIKKTLPAPPPSAPPPSGAPDLPPEAFVSASVLTLRSAPSATAEALATVPIGAKVQVLAQDGAFAKVRAESAVRPMRVLVLAAGDEGYVVPAASSSPVEGFASAMFLAPSPPDAAALAKQAESGDAAARVTALERLAAVERQPATWARLAQAAFDLGKCGVAANAARQIARGQKVLGGYALEALTLFYRCRGEVTRAVTLVPTDKQLRTRKLPRDACVNVDPQPDCGFCPLEYDDPEGRAAQRAQAAAEKREAAFSARMEAISELFPLGPFLRLRLRRASGEAERLVVVGQQLLPEPCGDAPQPPVVQGTPLVLPEMSRDEAIDLWLEVPSYEAQAYTVMREGPFQQAYQQRETALERWRANPSGDMPWLSLSEGWNISGPAPTSCCCD